jgi:general L-amino acid transport system permease protein
MADLTYVRREMAPPQEPPRSEIGVLAWMRQNLFSNWLNALLTLASIYFVWQLAAHILPWFRHAVWNAGSLQECREIIRATWGEDATGACFAVLKERWRQFLFGFYPSDLYWRPTLAFALLFVALAPILFIELPRKLLWFSVIFPGVAYWLLWGGSIFVPVVAYAGFVIAALAFSALAGRGLTILAFIGIAASLPLGILLALGRRSDLFFIKTICVGFIEFIRGVPLITLLFVASFLLPHLPAAGHELRHHPARHHHGDAVRRGLHGRDDPRRPRRRCRAASTRRPTRSASTTGSRCG